MKKTYILGILIGEAPTKEKAQSIVLNSTCPYCACYTYSDRTVVGVFTMPPDHKWWLEWVKREPKKTIGLSSADVFFTEGIEASSQWSRGEVTPTDEEAPCGARCNSCPMYRDPCEGCPATSYYREK